MLFTCKANCKTCNAEDCPYKKDEEIKHSFSNSTFDIKKKEVEKIISPEWLFTRFDINLFNFIGSLLTLKEIDEDIDENFIRKTIKKNIPLSFLNLLNRFTVLSFLFKRIELVLSTASKKILLAINNQCTDKNCYHCWMRDACPQKQTQDY